MARSFFHLVPRIVAEDKFVDVSVLAIIRAARSETFKPQFTREIMTKDSDGSDVTVSLVVNVGGSVDSWVGWSVALMMHSVRIDGIDHEFQYKACNSNGERIDGWHRHIWRDSLREADTCKIPIEGFEDCLTLENFLFRIARVMKITWNRADNADLFEIEK